MLPTPSCREASSDICNGMNKKNPDVEFGASLFKMKMIVLRDPFFWTSSIHGSCTNVVNLIGLKKRLC